MCWSGFLLNDNKENTLYFKVKAEKSIFIVSTVCKTCCKDLLAFEKHIQLLYEERVETTVDGNAFCRINKHYFRVCFQFCTE